MRDSIGDSAGIYGIKALVVACSVSLLAGCGGGGWGGGTPVGGSDGGSGGGGSGPGDVSSAVPSDVDGLARLGNNYGLLYTQVLAGTDMAGLFMVSPEAPQTPLLADGDIGSAFFGDTSVFPPVLSTIGAGNYDSVFLTFHEGDVISMRADGSDRRTLDTAPDIYGQSIETPFWRPVNSGFSITGRRAFSELGIRVRPKCRALIDTNHSIHPDSISPGVVPRSAHYA